MSKKSDSSEVDTSRSVRDVFYPKGRKRGLIVRIQIDYSRVGEVLRYSLSLIDLSQSLDNGRVVGCDNAHGQHHRHNFGRVEQAEFESYESLKGSLRRKSVSILKRGPARRRAPTRVGVESMDDFFSRMKRNAIELDRKKAVEPGFHLSFEDAADFLEVITPARVRLLREISTEPMTLSALALSLARDPAAVRRDVALLESQNLVTTSKVSNTGHGRRTLVWRVAKRIELAAVV